MAKIFILILLAAALVVPARGQAIRSVRIPKGESADIWFGVNVTGKVSIRVVTRDGSNKLNLWWITWGVGSAQSLGNYGPAGDLPIPITWWKGVISARLRGQASSDTVVYFSDKVQVDKNVTFIW
jgi:hypothetical protein